MILTLKEAPSLLSQRAGGLSAGYIPFGHSTSGYLHSPPLGTEGVSGAGGIPGIH